MRRKLNFFSLLASVPILTSSVSACQSANSTIVLDNFLNQHLNNTSFSAELKIESNPDQLQELIARKLALFTIDFFLEKKANIIDEAIFDFTKKESWDKSLYTIQIWDLTKNEVITFADLEEPLQNQGTLKLEFVMWNEFNSVVNFTFEIQVTNEKTNAEIKNLIDNYDYTDGILSFLIKQKAFNKLYHGIELAQFNNIINLNFTNFYADWIGLTFFNKADFQNLKIKHNDHELTQDDLNNPDQLNLTVGYEYQLNEDVVQGGQQLVLLKLV